MFESTQNHILMNLLTNCLTPIVGILTVSYLISYGFYVVGYRRAVARATAQAAEQTQWAAARAAVLTQHADRCHQYQQQIRYMQAEIHQHIPTIARVAHRIEYLNLRLKDIVTIKKQADAQQQAIRAHYRSIQSSAGTTSAYWKEAQRQQQEEELQPYIDTTAFIQQQVNEIEKWKFALKTQGRQD